MYIKGIGKVKKEDVMSILTTDGKEAVNNGDISIEELEEMYKLEQVKTLSQIGSMLDTFRESYKWIPDELKVELSSVNFKYATLPEQDLSYKYIGIP